MLTFHVIWPPFPFLGNRVFGACDWFKSAWSSTSHVFLLEKEKGKLL